MRTADFERSRYATRARSTRIALLLLLLTSIANHNSFAQDFYEREIGDFTVRFNAGANEREHEIANILIEDEQLFQLLAEIDNSIMLANRVYIIFEPWHVIAGRAGWDPNDEPNATHKDGSIFISYGLVVDVIDRFQRYNNYGYSLLEFNQKILPNIIETLLHEVGHALIHVNRMPTFDVGHEIIADQLAFFIMSELYEEDVLEPIIQHYVFVASEVESGAVSGVDNVHPGAAERAKNLLCWIDGKWSFEVELESRGRGEECEDEYIDLMDEWHGRLDGWWRE